MRSKSAQSVLRHHNPFDCTCGYRFCRLQLPLPILFADIAPPTLVAKAAEEFTRTDGDIRRVGAVIVSAPEFYAEAAVRAKVRAPYLLVVSAYRAMGGVPDSAARSVNLSLNSWGSSSTLG